MEEKKRVKISKQMAYLLRHEPSGIKISDEGYAELSELLDKLRERWPNLTAEDVREVVEEDPKGRYEINEGKVRARYGHSIDVDPNLTTTSLEVLYHGTTPEAADEILEEGLKPKGRQKVHLSRKVKDAIEVGKRRSENPTILEIDVKGVMEEGIRIERASNAVFVAEEIPPEFITIFDEEPY